MSSLQNFSISRKTARPKESFKNNILKRNIIARMAIEGGMYAGGSGQGVRIAASPRQPTNWQRTSFQEHPRRPRQDRTQRRTPADYRSWVISPHLVRRHPSESRSDRHGDYRPAQQHHPTGTRARFYPRRHGRMPRQNRIFDRPVHKRQQNRPFEVARHRNLHCRARESETGRSYKYFTSREESLSEIMEKRLDTGC